MGRTPLGQAVSLRPFRLAPSDGAEDPRFGHVRYVDLTKEHLRVGRGVANDNGVVVNVCRSTAGLLVLTEVHFPVVRADLARPSCARVTHEEVGGTIEVEVERLEDRAVTAADVIREPRRVAARQRRRPGTRRRREAGAGRNVEVVRRVGADAALNVGYVEIRLMVAIVVELGGEEDGELKHAHAVAVGAR